MDLNQPLYAWKPNKNEPYSKITWVIAQVDCSLVDHPESKIFHIHTEPKANIDLWNYQ